MIMQTKRKLEKGTIKIYLCDLVHNVPGNYVVPLNVAYIAAYANSIFKDEVDIELFKDPDQLLKAINAEPPQILAFSNYSWNFDLNRTIGKHVKYCYPATIIVMGGPNIRVDKIGVKNFLNENKHIDFYIPYEGEQPFVNLINFVKNKDAYDAFPKKVNEIKGCAYLDGKRIVYFPADPIFTLDKIPSPYLSRYLDRFLRNGLIPLIETSRGCPFGCTFCTWGSSAQKKVRTYSLKRSYDEIDYINNIASQAPLWIFADANFGLFEKDELIAKKIQKIRERNPYLRNVVFWFSKNHHQRNLRIFNYLSQSEKFLIAVQSFDPVVLKNVKRADITMADMPKIIKEAKQLGIKTSTDILLGLPGETKGSHVETLRKAFDIGFDHIDVGNIRLLAGSELETNESRKRYRIQTKFRLIQGAYGIYRGIKSLEAEEVIRATSAMNEQEISYFRLVHWLIWFGWNNGFLLPLLKYLQFKNINPLDTIIKIIDTNKDGFSLIDRLFCRFRDDAEKEWFPTYNDLRRHYIRDRYFIKLLNGGFSKMNNKYTAELILNRKTYLAFIDFIEHRVINDLIPTSTIPPDLFIVLKERIIDINEVNRNSAISKKSFSVPSRLLPFIISEKRVNKMDKSQFATLVFSREDEHVKTLKNLYKKFNFIVNKQMAIEKILETLIDGFIYNISVRNKR